MMEENNDIFLAGGDVLVYLAGPMHKKNIPQHLFGTIHLVRTYLKTDFSITSPSTHLYTFWMTPLHSPSCVSTYLMRGLFLKQNINKNIPISYSLKYKHSKNKFFTKK